MDTVKLHSLQMFNFQLPSALIPECVNKFRQ